MEGNTLHLETDGSSLTFTFDPKHARLLRRSSSPGLKVRRDANPEGGWAHKRTGTLPVAEEVGFEPTVPFRVRRFSRPLP